MTSHELAKKLLELPDSDVLIYTEDEKLSMDWQPIKSFTVGATGVKLSELKQEYED